MSVLPSIIAWLSLLTPTYVGLLSTGLALAGFAYYDVTQAHYPPWFKALRIMLSTLAVSSIFLTLFCKFILREGD